MKPNLRFKSSLRFAWILLLAPVFTEAQCELFKSEMEGVHNYVARVSHLIDSLQTSAESASFATQFKMARSNTRKVEVLMGQAVASSYESVSMASEAQYYSEICGIDEVKSYAIDAENFATDARDFIDEAYANAQKANTAKSLADIQYFMRKSQVAGKEARKSADDAANASSVAYYSCHHNDTAVMERDR